LLHRIKLRAGVALPDAGAGDPAAPPALVHPELLNLPAELSFHIADTLGKDGELVIFTDSAAWAARLKLWLAERLDAAACRRVTVRIRQQQRNSRPRKKSY
jgi:hypothetical protein